MTPLLRCHCNIAWLLDGEGEKMVQQEVSWCFHSIWLRLYLYLNLDHIHSSIYIHHHWKTGSPDVWKTVDFKLKKLFRGKNIKYIQCPLSFFLLLMVSFWGILLVIINVTNAILIPVILTEDATHCPPRQSPSGMWWWWINAGSSNDDIYNYISQTLSRLERWDE